MGRRGGVKIFNGIFAVILSYTFTGEDQNWLELAYVVYECPFSMYNKHAVICETNFYAMNYTNYTLYKLYIFWNPYILNIFLKIVEN